MRNNNYKDNRQWSDEYMPQVKEIILNLLPDNSNFVIKDSDVEVDMKEATDLIVTHPQLGGFSIGSRLRDEYALGNWPYDFTIRHAYTAGHKTEYTKVGEEGYCNMNFYGFVLNDKIVRWVIIDFNQFRDQHEFVDGVLVPKPHLKYSLEKNTDGRNDFFAYDINSFENLEELVVASSEGYFNDVEERNFPGVKPFYLAKRKELRIDF